jgi:fluoride exporter
MKFLMIAFFGLVGVFSRYGINAFFIKETSGGLPVATFLINLLGSFLIGVVYVLGIERSAISDDLRVALMVGLLGGFTTFSAYSLETTVLIKNNQNLFALSYVLASTVFGVLLTFGGIFLTRQIAR